MRFKKSINYISQSLYKIRKFKLTKRISLISSFVILLLAIVSPTVLAKNTDKRVLVKNNNSEVTPSPVSKSEAEPVNSPGETEPTESKQTVATPTPPPAKPSQAPNKTAKTQPSTTLKTKQNATATRQDTVSTDIGKPKPVPAGILGYINQVRAENSLTQLTYNSQLNEASKAKSQDMLEKSYFAHTNPDGKTDFDFIRNAGYIFSFAGSNIAQGNFGSEKGLFDAWMNSPRHRANILDSRAREFGYGVSGSYFTMMVGAR